MPTFPVYSYGMTSYLMTYTIYMYHVTFIYSLGGASDRVLA